MTPGKIRKSSLCIFADGEKNKNLLEYCNLGEQPRAENMSIATTSPPESPPTYKCCTFWSGSMNFSDYKKRSSCVSLKGQVISLKYGNNLFISLRWPLALGVFLGLIPIRGLLSGKHSFTWFHLRTLITIVVTISLFFQTFFIGHHFGTLIVKGQNSAGDLVIILSGVWFYLAGSLISLFFLLKSKQICEYFDKWIETSCILSEYSKPDKALDKHVNSITLIILLNCIGENVLYHFHAMEDERRRSLNFAKFLFDYYNSNQYIFPFFNYTPAITVALLITNKIATLAWNFADLVLILISRALYGKFKALNSFVDSRMETYGSLPQIRKGTLSWRTVRNNFHLITELLHNANCILSPLIWLSFTTDIFFICRQLYEGLVPRPLQATLINKVYVVWSLILLIGRSIGVNMMATMMSEEAHRMLKITQFCHPDEYDIEVRRLERYLSNHIFGITGANCFTITRSFLMKIISVIFTLEVVLLQNAHLKLG